MASSETNAAKRDLMSRVVEARLRDGWEVAQLAALMRVTPGTVRSWRHGESMGTNAQRAELANLKPPAEERPRLLEIAAQLRLDAFADKRNAASLRRRADFLETIGRTK